MLASDFGITVLLVKYLVSTVTAMSITVLIGSMPFIQRTHKTGIEETDHLLDRLIKRQYLSIVPGSAAVVS